MKKRTFWVILAPLALLLGLITAHGCWKIDDPTPDTPLTEEDKLPPATQEGKNTFGCLVNGKAFKPKRGGILQPGIKPNFSEITNDFGLTGRRYYSDFLESVNVWVSNVEMGDNIIYPLEILTYSDTSSVCPNAITKDPSTGLGSRYYKYPNGTLTITKLDKTTGIISGTFEFDAYSEECGDTVHISQGRFDVKYKN